MEYDRVQKFMEDLDIAYQTEYTIDSNGYRSELICGVKNYYYYSRRPGPNQIKDSSVQFTLTDKFFKNYKFELEDIEEFFSENSPLCMVFVNSENAVLHRLATLITRVDIRSFEVCQ